MNRASHRFIPCLALLVGLATVAIASPEGDAERAALTWLSLVDRTQYAQSWDRASPLFRRQVTQERWVDAVKGVRTPLGNLRSRTLLIATYRQELPGAPDGEWVILRFATTFENKRDAVETVTMMRVDGDWMASGYFVR